MKKMVGLSMTASVIALHSRHRGGASAAAFAGSLRTGSSGIVSAVRTSVPSPHQLDAVACTGAALGKGEAPANSIVDRADGGRLGGPIIDSDARLRREVYRSEMNI
jgi:hypothetical protein